MGWCCKLKGSNERSVSIMDSRIYLYLPHRSGEVGRGDGGERVKNVWVFVDNASVSVLVKDKSLIRTDKVLHKETLDVTNNACTAVGAQMLFLGAIFPVSTTMIKPYRFPVPGLRPTTGFT